MVIEVSFSVCVGMLVGLLVYATTSDSVFGAAIAVAITLQILVGGVFAFLFPLVYQLVLRRSPRMWHYVISQAVQDIVGCLTMIFFCYHVLLHFHVQNPIYNDFC
jgi:hypothetical protein